MSLELAKLELQRRGDAEWQAVGSCLLDHDGQHVDALAAILEPRMFADERCRLVFEAVQKLRRTGQPTSADVVWPLIDHETVKTEDLERMLAEVPHAWHAEFYGRQVREAWLLREFGGRYRAAVDELSAPGAGVEECLRTFAGNVDRLTDEAAGGEPESNFGELLLSCAELESEVTRIPSGIDRLDRTIKGGFSAGQFVCVGARPSVGKTSLLGGFALSAVRNDIPALFLSFEMSAREMTLRFRAQADVRLDDPISAGMASEWPLHICEAGGWSIDKVEATVRQYARKYDVRIALVDYLSLVGARDRRLPRWEQVGDISRSLKRLAMSADVVIVAAQQFNREVEKRGNRKPLMSDFRDSGSVEQDADILLGLDRETRPDAEDPPTIGMLYLMKHRNGPTANISVDYYPERTLFRDQAESAYRAAASF